MANVDSVASITKLRTTDPNVLNITSALVESYYGDGSGIGGGIFVWDATSTSADDAGTIIQVMGVATGRWRRIFERYNLEDFGVRPQTNPTDFFTHGPENVTAFNAASSVVPEGTTLYWSSGVLIVQGASGIVVTRRVGFVCSSPKDHIAPNFANTVDVFTWNPPPGGIAAWIEFDINIAEVTNSCRDAISIHNLISPKRAKFSCHSGAARYGLLLAGIEDANVEYFSTINEVIYPNQNQPLTHVAIHDSEDGLHASTTTSVRVDISGGTNGMDIATGISGGLASVVVTGVIQGLSATPLNVVSAANMKITDLFMEQSGQRVSTFNNCNDLQLNNVYAFGEILNFVNCQGFKLENVNCDALLFDANCKWGSDNRTRFTTGNGYGINRAYTTHETLIGARPDNASLTIRYGGAGSSLAKTLATNGLMQTWTAGVPNEWSGTNTTWTHWADGAGPWENSVPDYAQATVSTTSLNDGPNYTPSIPHVLKEDFWISFMVILTGNQGDTVYVWDGQQFNPVISLPATFQWVALRASYKIPAGGAWMISPRPTVNPLQGNFFIGGIAWCYGQTSPKYLQ